MLYSVVLVSAAQQCESAICIHISSLCWASHPLTPSHSSRSSQSMELSSLCYKQLPAICFMHGSVYMPVLFSRFAQPSPSHSVSKSPFCMSAFLFLPWKLVHHKLVVVHHCQLSLLATPLTVSLPGSSAHGISQARILGWVASPVRTGHERS